MRMSSSGRSRAVVDEENPYWISFSDIMAALLVIFILAAVALILELEQKREQWDKTIAQIAKAEETRKEILLEIQEELRNRNIIVDISENQSVIPIPADILSFSPREHRIPEDPEFQNRAREIGQVIYTAITKGDRLSYLDTIFIEGHSDKNPYYNPAIYGNWGLSTLRAISVWNFWNDLGGANLGFDNLDNIDGKKLFSVSGYGETRPDSNTLADPDSETSLRKNRRIDVRFTIRRPNIAEYEAIRSQLK
ncbi:MAG TPA: chemotaxis protein MotB [Flavobacteriales bacterium]|nr:chemotaxis protein MotB [Flavobacteriales bacterium]